MGYETQQNHRVFMEGCEEEAKTFGLSGLRGAKGSPRRTREKVLRLTGLILFWKVRFSNDL